MRRRFGKKRFSSRGRRRGKRSKRLRGGFGSHLMSRGGIRL